MTQCGTGAMVTHLPTCPQTPTFDPPSYATHLTKCALNCPPHVHSSAPPMCTHLPPPCALICPPHVHSSAPPMCTHVLPSPPMSSRVLPFSTDHYLSAPHLPPLDPALNAFPFVLSPPRLLSPVRLSPPRLYNSLAPMCFRAPLVCSPLLYTNGPNVLTWSPCALFPALCQCPHCALVLPGCALPCSRLWPHCAFVLP
ncbi:unnamed protein product [Closterium sp. Naga37s-1]|nr:unnamed protein product [Closterium sp. Naga37s-1]